MLSAKKALKILQDEQIRNAKIYKAKHPDIVKQFEEIIIKTARNGDRITYNAEIFGVYDLNDFIKYGSILGYKITYLKRIKNGYNFKISY